MLTVDLHTHSTRSDGTLTPTELVRRAHARGVGVLALTDHDDISGFAEATRAGHELGVRVLSGVEISVTWNGTTLHVVALDFDPGSPALVAGLGAIRSGRLTRAEKIAQRLAASGVHAPLEGALRYAGNPSMVGRTHFARMLVERGAARDVGTAFRKYLAQGRPGYVRHRWAELAQAVHWVRDAGGIAVLAHPARYDLRTARMDALLEEFATLGGGGLEVVSGNHTADEQVRFGRLAIRHGLDACAGSDFHGPGESWWDVGQLPELPVDCTPVWRKRPHWGAA